MPIQQADYSNINHEEMAAGIGLNVKHIPILIASFVEETNNAIIKLQDAISAKDYEAVHQQTHFIKGSAGNLQFNEIYKMSQEMEHAATNKNPDFDYDGYFNAIKDAVSTIK